MAHYFYTRNGEKHGPFTAEEFKNLAAAGDLLPSDLVWKEGKPKWVKASTVKGLLPASSSTASSPVSQRAHGQDRSPEPAVAASSKPDQPAFRHRITARQLALLSAERTKIVGISLPLAYTQLGQHCYERRVHAESFPEIFSELDELTARIAENRAARSIATSTSLGVKVKAFAHKGLRAAIAQKFSLQRRAVFARLGRLAHGRRETRAALTEAASRVSSMESRLEAVKLKLVSADATPARRVFYFSAACGIAATLIGVFVVRPLLLSRRANRADATVAAVSNTRDAEAVNRPKPGAPFSFQLGERQGRTPPSFTTPSPPQRPDSASPSPQVPGEPNRRAEPRAERREVRKDPSALKEYLRQAVREQEIRIEGPSAYPAFPAPKRVQSVIKVIETPNLACETGWDRIDACTVDADESLLVASNRTVVSEQLTLRLPRFARCVFEPAIDPEGKGISWFDWANEKELDLPYYLNQRRANLAPAFNAFADQSALIGNPVVFTKDLVISASDAPILQHGTTQHSGSLCFFRRDKSAISLVDAMPLQLGCPPDRLRISRVEQMAQHGESTVLFVAGGGDPGEPRDTSLEVWSVKGLAGSMFLSFKVGSEVQEPRFMALSPTAPMVALAYPHSIRLVSLAAVKKPCMPLAADKVVSLDGGVTRLSTDTPALFWTPDGTCIISQRVRKTEGSDILSTVEVVDSRTGALVATHMFADDTGKVLDIDSAGKRMAVACRYSPLPGVSLPEQGPYEVSVLSLPRCEVLQRFHTCFAKRGWFLAETSLLTAGVADPRVRAEILDEFVDAQYANLWDTNTGLATAALKSRRLEVVFAKGSKIISTTERSGEKSASLLMWDLAADGPSMRVDEFKKMRQKSIEKMFDNYEIITALAPPVGVEFFNEIALGMTYPEVKRRAGGAGAFGADVVESQGGEILRATVWFDVAESAETRVKLVFEGDIGNLGTRIEQSLKLIVREFVGR